MVKLGHIALDSVRLKANAAKRKTKKLNELEEALKETKAKITQILNQAETKDLEEERTFDKEAKGLPKELRDKQKFLAKLKEAKVTLQRLGIDKANLTDPEATLQKTEYGIKPGYSGQCAMDETRQVIVAQNIVTKPEDTDQLKPLVEQVKDNLKAKPDELSADAGYYSGENIKYLEDEQIDGYLPGTSNNKTKKSDDNLGRHTFSKEHFRYSPEEDVYICPEGKQLKYSGTRIWKKKKYKYKKVSLYKGTACPACPSKSQCLNKSKSSRWIERDGFEEYRARMKLKMQTKEAKRIYFKRAYTTEPVFGHLKYNLGYRHLLLRGLKNVQSEFTLMCIGHNIAKIWEFSKN